MSLNDQDQKVVDFYLKDAVDNNPALFAQLSGRKPEEVLAWAKGEPDFSDIAKAAYGTLGAGSKVGVALDRVENYAGAVLDNTDKMLGTGGSSVNPIPAVKDAWNKVVGPVGDAANYISGKLLDYGTQNSDTILGSAAKTLGEMASDSGPVNTKIDNLGALGLIMAPVAGAIGEAAGAKTSFGPGAGPSDEELFGLKLGPNAPVNAGPQGVAPQIKPAVAEVPALTARELATTAGIRIPAVHNLAAKNIVESNLQAVHDFASGFYNQLADPNGPYFQSGQKEVPEAFDQHVEDMRPFTDQVNALPKQLRTGTTNRLAKALNQPEEEPELDQAAKEANYQALVNAGFPKESLDAMRESSAMTPEEKQPFTVNSLASMRKMYSSIYAKNYGNPIGAMAKAGVDSASDLMSKYADPSWKAQLDQGNSAWSMYKKTYDNPYVQDFLSKDSADLHDTLMGSKRGSAEAVNAVQAAGGDDAITNLKKSHTYDLLGKVAGAGDSEKTFLQYQYDHQDSMNALYSIQEQDEFRKLAQGLDKTKDNYATAVKQNQTSTTKANELASADTIEPGTEKPIPVEIKSKQASGAPGVYDAAKTVAGVFSPGLKNAMTLGEKLLRAKEALKGN